MGELLQSIMKRTFVETWKYILGYDNKYQISNLGEVRSLDRVVVDSLGKKQPKKGQRIKPTEDKDGYLSVRLYKRSPRTNKVYGSWNKVHRLVIRHFLMDDRLTNRIPLQVNHKDGNKKNNSIYNLEWCTDKENKNHAHKNGFYDNSIGENHYKAKLTIKQVKEIRKKYKPYKYSCKKLAEEYDVSPSTIEHLIRNESWKNI